MENFLETQNIPKLNHKDIENLYRTISSKKIESVIENFPTRKNLRPHGFTVEFYQHLKNNSQNSSSNPSKKIEEEGSFSKSFIALIPMLGKDTVRILQMNSAYEH